MRTTNGKTRNDILTGPEHEELKHARNKARRSNGFEIKIPPSKRVYYRLQDERARRLARWQDVEDAIFRLCSDRDIRGGKRGDRERTGRAVAMLQDTFTHNGKGG